ncbi:2-C-methyl-D-erythritol 4-phosphate cytidylyltransferase [Kangiella sediminilitoris]|uniref:2-C-methyl-D-erythritol 4-phosphate cytidylyltransferase n=1 Tax=Kangiella sediminilitoris TaxID=1144748 RepID=A0A1B3BBS6_9GAMM|nr:2-C-methyl-D-erythritol 4-phosphate cytidylyltransferase [Kangiella sediminilitoris]AOE50238.1 2-C-methyl-D-erythritol 4-phosphate cytidylyltransferase [Kangiella sediminilitoris]
MSSGRIWAVIPAAGIGSRMNSDTPKQYLEIDDKTILEHSINRFLEHSKIHKVIVVLNPKDSHWQELPFKNNSRVVTVIGGKERVDSVLAGLHAIQEQEVSHHDWVMVHDAARPCLKSEHIDDLIHSRDSSPDGAILAIGVTDTVKQANHKQTIDRTIDRESIWLAQTPQLFPVDSLIRSIELALSRQQLITDEASAMELSGYHPSLVIGSRKNIKITEPEDLFLASLWLNNKK